MRGGRELDESETGSRYTQPVPYKDGGVAMESRQPSALLSEARTVEVPESQ